MSKIPHQALHFGSVVNALAEDLYNALRGVVSTSPRGTTPP